MNSIGILSIQGAVSEHVMAVKGAMKNIGMNGRIIEVKKKIPDLDALIIPGGESTTIGDFLWKTGMDVEIKKLAKSIPILGTCAGAIILAKEGDEQVKRTHSLALMNMKINRNAFGRQKESFEAELEIPEIGAGSFHGIFIRAPVIEKVWGDAKVLGRYCGKIVAVQENNMVALSFHPELVSDTRIHEYFLRLI